MAVLSLKRTSVKVALACIVAAVVAVGGFAFASGAGTFIGDDLTPTAGETHDLTVTGGVEGTDYEFVSVNYSRVAYTGTSTVGNAATPMLLIKTDTPLTISNSTGVATATTGIRIDAGVDAHLTFDNVVIQADVPCDIVTNSASPRTTDKTLAGEPTKLHLVLADGSVNQLLANATMHAPGLRCGEGSELYIDDAVPNVDTDGNAIVPDNGFIPVGTTYVSNDGKTYTVTGADGDNALTNLDSRNPGSLKVVGGYRAAAIGGGSFESSGKLTFDGGVFEVRAWTKTGNNRPSDTSSGVNTDWDMGDGAGIGGGYAGNGTQMFFNGGSFDVYGSYHGAAIGGGMYAYNTGSSPGNWPARAFPFNDAIYSGRTTSSAASGNAMCTPGDITINGGFIKATGGLHGNAFGQACGGTADGCTILITGGTLLPNSYGTLKMIGGTNGYVVVTGGSVNCTKTLFSGIGDTAWGVLNGYDDPANKVFMTTIDLSADGWVNDTIVYFGLTINGEAYNYGAPSRFDNGKLYLWLPETAVGKEVRVSLTGEKVSDDGEITRETPADLYIPSVTTDGSSKLKRYIDFQLPEDWRQENWYKDYNGLPFPTYDFATQPAIETNENPPKQLTTATGVSYKYQYLDENGDGVGEEITVDSTHTMPVDASKFTITMTSTQYSNQDGFKESYWGHRAYGEAEIRKVASSIPTLKAQWYDASGNLVDDEDHVAKATDVLRITAQVTSADSTALTCKAPTGTLELLVDGEVVERFTLPSAAGATATDGVTTVSSYADGREYVQFVYEAKASEKDYLLPTFTANNEHEITMNYVADKNYFDIMADEDPDMPKASVTVEPIDPDPGVTPNDDVTVEPQGEKDPEPGENVYEKTYGLTYNFKQIVEDDDDDEEEGDGEGAKKPDNTNTLTFEISSPSSGAFTVGDPTNTAVADGITVTMKTDEAGNPVKNAQGDYVYVVTVDVASAGESVFELTQMPNGAFYGTKFVIDLSVNPNPDIEPLPELSKSAVNLTHPKGAVQAGDRISYTIEAVNQAPGSVWWFPKLKDTLPEAVELDPTSLHLVNPSEGVDRALEEGEFTYADGTLEVGLGVITKLYGVQTLSLTFECIVKDDVGYRDASEDLKTVANTASATGYEGIAVPEDGTDPVDPDDPNVPAAQKPAATPNNPDPTDPAAPQNSKVLPKDPEGAHTSVDKQAHNLNRDSGRSEVGDTIEYTVTLTNDTPGSCWYAAAFLDTLPKGIVFEAGSAKLVTPTGDEIALSDDVYDASRNLIGVSVGDIYGSEKAVLTFRATVTDDALDSDLGNVANVVGTLPSDIGKDGPSIDDPDATDADAPGSSDVPTQPGKPYLPAGDIEDVLTKGGLPVDPTDPEGDKGILRNYEKAYPTDDDRQWAVDNGYSDTVGDNPFAPDGTDDDGHGSGGVGSDIDPDGDGADGSNDGAGDGDGSDGAVAGDNAAGSDASGGASGDGVSGTLGSIFTRALAATGDTLPVIGICAAALIALAAALILRRKRTAGPRRR